VRRLTYFGSRAVVASVLGITLMSGACSTGASPRTAPSTDTWSTTATRARDYPQYLVHSSMQGSDIRLEPLDAAQLGMRIVAPDRLYDHTTNGTEIDTHLGDQRGHLRIWLGVLATPSGHYVKTRGTWTDQFQHHLMWVYAYDHQPCMSGSNTPGTAPVGFSWTMADAVTGELTDTAFWGHCGEPPK
jgi:hypothetical protein